MMRLAIILVFSSFLLSLALLQSCRVEVDDFDITDTLEDLPVELVSTHIYGQVVDRQNKAIQGVSVSIRSEEVLTDENGYFSFEEIKADRNGTHIRANKTGYFQNTITVYPILNHSLYSSIILNEINASATLLSWEGGTIALGRDSWLDIEPNTLVYADDGSNFEGTAIFEMNLADPTSKDFDNLVPGDLTGLNELGQRNGISPLALIQMQVRDENGQELRLAKNQKAVLALEAREMVSVGLGSTVPMWYFDVDKNRWINNGIAQLSNEKIYIGEIDHFLDWCFASPYDIIRMDGLLAYEGTAEGAAQHQLIVIDKDEMITRVLHSDDDGVFSGYFPGNSPLQLVIENECGIIIYDEEIGSFDQTSRLDLELSEIDDCLEIPVSGRLMDCDGLPLANAYVQIQSEELTRFYRTDPEGRYEGTFKQCLEGLPVRISAVDQDAPGSDQHFDEIYLKEALTVGDWMLCGSIEGQVSIQFLDQLYLLSSESGYELSAGSALLYANSPVLYFDCYIAYFEGKGIYRIFSETEADFLIGISPNLEDAPEFFPDPEHFDSFSLIIDQYTESERIGGTMEGRVRDANHDDVEGMLYIRFSLPYVLK